jgi:hypothetical protein
VFHCCWNRSLSQYSGWGKGSRRCNMGMKIPLWFIDELDEMY